MYLEIQQKTPSGSTVCWPHLFVKKIIENLSIIFVLLQVASRKLDKESSGMSRTKMFVEKRRLVVVLSKQVSAMNHEKNVFF